MTKCVICERRPATKGGYCALCDTRLTSERKGKATIKPLHFLTYRGAVVGLFPNGNGRLKARLLNRKVEALPGGKTLDLNNYCHGFDRDKIKAFKACVLQLANA